MINEINIEIHSIKVNESGNTSKYFPLTNIGGQDLFTKFFEKIVAYKEPKTLEKGMVYYEFYPPEILENDYGKFIFGSVEKGIYGVEKQIANVKRRKKEKKLSKDETVLDVFYYLIYMPIHLNISSDQSVLVVQRIGSDGILSFIKPILEETLRNNIKNHVISFSPLCHIDYFNSYIENSRVRRLTLLCSFFPDDEIKRLTGKTDTGELEVEISIKGKGRLPLMDSFKNFLKKSEKKNPFITIAENYGFSKEQIKSGKIVTTNSRKVRTYRYEQHDSFKIPVIITNEVEFDKSGNPKDRSMKSVFMKYAIEFSAIKKYHLEV